MNLFTICDNTRAIAQSLDDRLLIRTIVESAQMLSTAIHCNDKIIDKPEGIYKKYNANEEHNVWVRESRQNYKWTFFYLVDCLTEFQYRFGKIHETYNIASKFAMYEDKFPNKGFTEFPRKFNKEYTNYQHLMDIPNVFNAYQEYLKTKWTIESRRGNVPSWTKREKPEFYSN